MESHQLKKGDNILITGKKTGVLEAVAEEIRLDNKTVGEVKKGDNFSLKLKNPVRAKDKLYKVIDSEWFKFHTKERNV